MVCAKVEDQRVNGSVGRHEANGADSDPHIAHSSLAELDLIFDTQSMLVFRMR